MTIEFKSVDSRGAIAVAQFANQEINFGIHVDILKLLQPALAAYQAGTLPVQGEYRVNTKPEQNMMALMFGMVEPIEAIPMDFKAYEIGMDEGEMYIMLIAEHEGYKYFAFGNLDGIKTHTVDVCPQGGCGSLPIANEDFDQFATDFQALVCEG